MRRSPTFLVLIFCAAGAWAQSDQYIISRQGSVTLFPVYQSWSAKDAGTRFWQGSALLSAYVPIGRSISVSARGSGATSRGDAIADLNGLSDIQVGGSYHWEAINTIFSLNLNIPTGKKELPSKEFLTSVLASNSLFNLQVPVLGQGFNIEPGAAWVFPVNDNVVLGLAASFQYRGSYKPREALEDYDPGDEFTGTAGVDIRITENISISTDLVLSMYSADKSGDTKVFASGNAYWGNIQYKQSFRDDELTIIAGYRNRSKGQIAGAGGLVDERERFEPGRFDASAQFRQVFGPRLSISYIAEARIFELTSAPLAGAKVFGVGVALTFSTGSKFFFPVRAKFQFGTLKGGETLTGVDAGIGVGFTF